MPLRFTDDLEVGNGNKAASVGYQRVACLVPVCVVFPADYMEEVAFGEAEFLGVTRVWVIIVKSFDDLGTGDEVSIPKQAISSLGWSCSPFSVRRWQLQIWV